MPKRSYNQFCGLAHALDLVGERWTLLIVRELLTGPKRYTELLDRLPGIGTNLLADRLRFLEGAGIVDKRSDYRLTGYGRGLKKAVVSLAGWGLESIGVPEEDDFYAGSWSVLAMHAVFRRDAAKGLCEAYEYRIGDDVFHAEVRDGELQTAEGPADEPAFVMHSDTRTYRDIVAGTLKLDDAIASDRVRIEGDRSAFERSVDIFGMGQFGGTPD